MPQHSVLIFPTFAQGVVVTGKHIVKNFSIIVLKSQIPPFLIIEYEENKRSVND